MRLTLHTDYALRVLVHTGKNSDGLVTINDIASCYDISKNHLTKVVHHLGRLGYLDTVRGKHGGIRLMVDPNLIKLGDFVREIEDDFALARCMRDDDETEPSCLLSSTCIAKKAFGEGIEAFVEALNRYTLAEMISAEKCRDQKLDPLQPLPCQ